jgi:hypothetical protein
MVLVIPCTPNSLKQSPHINGKNGARVFVDKLSSSHRKLLTLSDFMDVASKGMATVEVTENLLLEDDEWKKLKKGRSLSTKALDKYALLYVVQSKSDRYKGIYKLGVSSGSSRLLEYFKMHGDKQGRCSGVYLMYLAGVVLKPNTKQWNYHKEKQIKTTLKQLKIPSVRGDEWVGITKKNLALFAGLVKKPLVDISKENTERVAKAIEGGSVPTARGDGVKKVLGHGKVTADNPDKGKLYYILQWGKPQISTHLKDSGKDPRKIAKKANIPLTHLTSDTLESMLKREDGFNDLKRNMGTLAIQKIHKYIVDHKLEEKDLFYKKL